jgi:hypothetical protein
MFGSCYVIVLIKINSNIKSTPIKRPIIPLTIISFIKMSITFSIIKVFPKGKYDESQNQEYNNPQNHTNNFKDQ